MELFSAQPDLSLQISPPNTTPTSGVDLGFWRAHSSTNRSSKYCINSPLEAAKAADDETICDLSLASATPSSTYLHHHHHFHRHHPQEQERSSYHHKDLSLLKPIRGIPIYNSYSPSLPLVSNQQQQQHYLCDSSSIPKSTLFGARSRFLSSRFSPGKRNIRAPRMRWTATLHARFVHAVELLGGHESMI